MPLSWGPCTVSGAPLHFFRPGIDPSNSFASACGCYDSAALRTSHGVPANYTSSCQPIPIPAPRTGGFPSGTCGNCLCTYTDPVSGGSVSFSGVGYYCDPTYPGDEWINITARDRGGYQAARNCVFHYCNDPVFAPAGAQHYWICECASCNIGTCFCQSSSSCLTCNCPPGTAWDIVTCQCVPNCTGQCRCGTACITCPLVQCKTQLGCWWSPTLCAWQCNAPGCSGGYHWDYGSCKCTCSQPSAPRCAVQLHCTWDAITCLWVCDDPPACPAGQHWDYSFCACVTCPAHQCWCGPSGTCVTCSDPPCEVARGCVWNETSCSFDCTNPPCPSGQTFSLATCTCQVGPPGIDLLEAEMGWVFRAYQDGTGNVIVEKTRNAGVTWE